jgi:DnaJ-class molecular chaperone
VPFPRGSRRGDLMVDVKVLIPRTLTASQQRLLEELAREEPESHAQAAGHPEEEGILKKIWHSVRDHIQKS